MYHCQKSSKLAQARQSYWKNKKGAVFLKHSVICITKYVIADANLHVIESKHLLMSFFNITQSDQYKDDKNLHQATELIKLLLQACGKATAAVMLNAISLKTNAYQ